MRGAEAAAAVLLSAFLLFLLQPMMGRLVMPLFGGGAPVWTTCLVFFQVALVLGYAYAMLSMRWLPPRPQRLLHVVLMVASLAALPILLWHSWPTVDATPPQLGIAKLLLLSISAPYVLLAATGPLVQAWLARAGRTPWRLFALSNLASIAALLAYPFAVEPLLGLAMQTRLWSGLYGLAILLVAALAWRTRHATPEAGGRPFELQLARVTSGPLVWMMLAALPSAFLVATTDHMTRDLPAIPLVWIAPLALYLLSLVAWFDGRLHYHRPFWLAAATLAVLGMARVVSEGHLDLEPTLAVPLFSTALFAICLFCHGELAQLRPDA